MKLHKIILLSMVLLLSMILSCSKDIAPYDNDARAYFNERFIINATNNSQLLSKSFSFAPYAVRLQDTTVLLKVKIMGLATGADRTFGAEAVPTVTTAVAGTEYKLLPGTIKANQTEGLLPVVLYRAATLKTTLRQLTLKIADYGDFKGGTVENNIFTLFFNDDYIKPDNWDTAPGLKSYFGVFSVTKYKFIVAVLGRADFPIQTSGYDPLKFSNADLLDKKAILQTALLAYNSSHTPVLTDETGLAVTFP